MKMEVIDHSTGNIPNIGNIPPWLCFDKYSGNSTELMENGTSVKITSGDKVFLFDTIKNKWE